MPQKNAIQTENLTKRYGDHLAVDHISFQVNEGEIFGFLGPNGSGKTSTIHMLVGLSQPEEGRTTILGYHLPAEIARAKRYMGVVPGLIAMTILFSTTAAEAVVINFELRLGTLERLLLAPVSITSVILGKVLGGFLFGC